MKTGPFAAYQSRLQRGAIAADPAQEAVARRLQALHLDLNAWRPDRTFLSRLTGRQAEQPPRGLYIHGKVGRGKTMLMDLLFETSAIRPRKRLHFHEFMAEVHDRIALARQSSEGDPLPRVAQQIAAEARLLCFDEMHVTDIADAMILGRLFDGIFGRCVVVATSNALPGELYRHGLNRQLFLPFVAKLEAHLDVVELGAAHDYRLLKLSGRQLYFSPLGPAADAALEEAWQALTGVADAGPTNILVKGRRLLVRQAAMGAARFRFADLCENPLGPNDYLAIAKTFHTIAIEGIPLLDRSKRNEARRLINLIDTLYDNRAGLIVSAAAEPDMLYPAGDGADLFTRTASRLIEMRSEAYLADREARLRTAAGAHQGEGDGERGSGTAPAHA